MFDTSQEIIYFQYNMSLKFMRKRVANLAFLFLPPNAIRIA